MEQPEVLQDERQQQQQQTPKKVFIEKLDPQMPNGLHLRQENGTIEKQAAAMVARVYSRKRSRDTTPEILVKKPKQGAKAKTQEERVNGILGKTADIVLVLAGLAQMKAGKPPTEMEAQLAAEAQNNLSSLLSRVAPSSILPKSAVESMLGTMGLRRTGTGTIEPLPRPQQVGKSKADGEDSDSDDETSESISAKDDSNQLQSSGLLTSPSALSLDDEADGEMKSNEEFEEFQDEQSQLLRHKQLVKLVQQLKAESYVPQPMGEVNNSYMVTIVPCQICKMIVKDTTSVVVCDGCEKVYHCKCLPSYWEFPKGDWSCPTCNGVKPRYGPVRNKMPIRIPENRTRTGGVPAASAAQQQTTSGVTSVANGLGEAVNSLPTVGSSSTTRPESVEESNNAVKKATQEGNSAAGAQETTNSGQVCLHVDWVGEPQKVANKRAYYSSCCVGGWTYKLQDCALFRPESPEIPPYIARLQTLWEDLDDGSKWVRVNWCYYPNDMPSAAGRPDSAEPDEVYESNHCDNNLVGSIQGPCQVLAPQKYREEKERRGKLFPGGLQNGDLPPIFLCRWTYDAPKGVFRKVVEGT